MKCPSCGITVPEMPEDATYEEMLCNFCYEDYELIVEYDNTTTYERENGYDD